MNNIKQILLKTFNFRGYTNRKVYWTYVISFYAFGIVMAIFFGIVERWYLKTNNLEPNGLMFQDIQSIIRGLLFLPIISATARRLRDAGLSPWLTLLPIINFLLCLKKSRQ